jgi:hypothetical protein
MPGASDTGAWHLWQKTRFEVLSNLTSPIPALLVCDYQRSESRGANNALRKQSNLKEKKGIFEI